MNKNDRIPAVPLGIAFYLGFLFPVLGEITPRSDKAILAMTLKNHCVAFSFVIARFHFVVVPNLFRHPEGP